MFDPILERVISYRRVVFESFSSWFSVLLNVSRHANHYIYIIFKKIRYSLELKKELYYLGKYVSKIDKRKYDLSSDKAFIDMMARIGYMQKMVDRNDRDLSELKDKDKTSKYF